MCFMFKGFGLFQFMSRNDFHPLSFFNQLSVGRVFCQYFLHTLKHQKYNNRKDKWRSFSPVFFHLGLTQLLISVSLNYKTTQIITIHAVLDCSYPTSLTLDLQISTIYFLVLKIIFFLLQRIYSGKDNLLFL